MVAILKIGAAVLAYAALWQALSHYRVRGPERRLQLQVFGAVTALYLLMVAITGGASPEISSTPLVPDLAALATQYIHAYFGAFATTFSLLGLTEIAIGLGFIDPSISILSRWWVRALFEGPVWRLLCRRQIGLPLSCEECESLWRHTLTGLVTMASACWALQVATGFLELGRLDPVALVLFLKAANIWLDARIRTPECGGRILSGVKHQCAEPAGAR